MLVRLTRRLEHFESPQLDELAQRMGVLTLLARRHRYFFAGKRYSAFSFSGGIAFGRPYWNVLTDGERAAIAAHEFAHIKHSDGRQRTFRIFVPSAVVALGLGFGWMYGFAGNVSDSVVQLLAPVLSLVVFVWVFAGVSMVQAPWRRRMELSCDAEAAKYTNGEDLIRALQVWENGIPEKVRRTIAYRIQSRYYPSLAERVGVIRNAERGAQGA